jgi:hypothetical protein
MIRSEEPSWLFESEIQKAHHDEGEHSLVAGRIDEVTTCVVICVKEFERRVLVHVAKADSTPLIADAHSAELNGRDANAGIWGKDTIAAKPVEGGKQEAVTRRLGVDKGWIDVLGWGLRGGFPVGHCWVIWIGSANEAEIGST